MGQVKKFGLALYIHTIILAKKFGDILQILLHLFPWSSIFIYEAF